MAVAVLIIYPFLAFIVAPFIVPNLRKIEYQNVSSKLQKVINNLISETDDKNTILDSKIYCNTC
ncbi:hypothetical protein BMS3Abin15_00689 [bacterium BMS3Abin15]|nr:hypothetical protein BMS3Abin15_00689 [bacterium BMS3Abin15]